MHWTTTPREAGNATGRALLLQLSSQDIRRRRLTCLILVCDNIHGGSSQLLTHKKKERIKVNQFCRTVTSMPLQVTYQVVLSRLIRPRYGKPVLVCIPSRLHTRGPDHTRTECFLPLQGENTSGPNVVRKKIFAFWVLFWFATLDYQTPHNPQALLTAECFPANLISLTGGL